MLNEELDGLQVPSPLTGAIALWRELALDVLVADGVCRVTAWAAEHCSRLQAGGWVVAECCCVVLRIRTHAAQDCRGIQATAACVTGEAAGGRQERVRQ